MWVHGGLNSRWHGFWISVQSQGGAKKREKPASKEKTKRGESIHQSQWNICSTVLTPDCLNPYLQSLRLKASVMRRNNQRYEAPSGQIWSQARTVPFLTTYIWMYWFSSLLTPGRGGEDREPFAGSSTKKRWTTFSAWKQNTGLPEPGRLIKLVTDLS